MKKIGFILILIIILPVAFLIFNEIGKLNETEEVLEETYNNQLEAILFSVNQYSDDIVNSWANKIVESRDDELLLQQFVRDNLALEAVVFFKYPENKINEVFVSDRITQFEKTVLNKIDSLINENKTTIERLIEYRKSGYRKFEPLNSANELNYSLLIFSAAAPDEFNELVCFVINSESFAKKILLPRIQQITQNKFLIIVKDNQNQFVVSSDNKTFDGNIEYEKPMWLIPNYKIGIVLLGETIQDLVRERATNNLILITVLLLILLFAVIFVFRAVKKELELAQLKADFVSNVSHELRTPLALISMFAETLELERVKNDEKKKEYYSIISQEANRLGRIVNSILNFAKMEAGKRKFTFEQKNINEVVDNIHQTYSYHLQNKGFKFEKELSSNIPEIKIDTEALSEAIINLIDNAVKYSDNRKEVILKTGVNNNSVFIEVIDKGIGIAAEEQKKIFDKFYRVSSGLIHNVKGTGIGLSLVKQIVEAHKGRIELKSNPGEGSTFRIIIPPIEFSS
ncbi:HAMP domain-containing sensor histidine kinase [Ignavibacterium sp.]|uniref:sensor histidine kinase n=1 Tax=Ignavibacterium sp. TaxID=2651167 RepID=UPI00307E53DE